MKLKRSFYKQPALVVAKDLLGKYLVRVYRGRKIIGKIVETEAYIGPEDKASHGFGGKMTSRNEAEFLEGGYIYIYLIYGMYWQLNITTGVRGKPECVLIRALEPIIDDRKTKNKKPKIKNTYKKSKNICNKICDRFVEIRNLADGPGRLCRFMKLDKSFYGEDLTKSKRIWIAASISSRRASPASPRLVEAGPKGREDKGHKVKKSNIVSAKRIGIDYAGQWAKKPWRFYIKDNPFVSRY